ncbi:hypothetical protein M9H77_21980 [Catharanthus roseus]|uniref:Uncharacterized protein n=1 Tax=Catharanthus roseus TaxID=4058 RepID=A0ACC0ARP6_CATRO|nr:hypothetical protein M9H77_21980 [Catharanthus roseus]
MRKYSICDKILVRKYFFLPYKYNKIIGRPNVNFSPNFLATRLARTFPHCFLFFFFFFFFLLGRALSGEMHSVVTKYYSFLLTTLILHYRPFTSFIFFFTGGSFIVLSLLLCSSFVSQGQ